MKIYSQTTTLLSNYARKTFFSKILVIMTIFCCLGSIAFAEQKSEYISPNFNPNNMKNILVYGCIPADNRQYVVDFNLQYSLAKELKENLDLKKYKADTLLEVATKLQKLTGKNILAMAQSSDPAVQNELNQIMGQYIAENYDTTIIINILQGNYGSVYSEGVTINMPTTRRSNVYFNDGTSGTVTTREYTPQTYGGGQQSTADVTLLIQIQNMSDSEIVLNRQVYRRKQTSNLFPTTPEDIGKRIVVKFAQDFNKKFNYK